MNYYFTSVSRSQLANAKLLAMSVKQHNADDQFILFFTDIEDESYDWTADPFDEIVHTHKLGIENFFQKVMQFSETDFGNEVKAFCANYILDQYPAGQVTYLAPDCEVFASLNELHELHKEFDIILVPQMSNTDAIGSGKAPDVTAETALDRLDTRFFSVASNENSRHFLASWHEQSLLIKSPSTIDEQSLENNFLDASAQQFDRLHVLFDPAYNGGIWNTDRQNLNLSDSKACTDWFWGYSANGRLISDIDRVDLSIQMRDPARLLIGAV